ncbi:aromatase/cyclase [Streptomyces sp. NPDC050145]|uniref:aromatase/cyclase n=1 Tax=Streptomyces sp. NPDC050145 TaxID=3365602 RepID=UPI0037AB39B9
MANEQRDGRVHRTVHKAETDAPADVVYRLIEDTSRWPLYLPPNVQVEQVETSGDSERLRMWATANGQVKSWTSRRVLDPAARRIEFRQEVPAAPVETVGGTWIVTELGPERSLLTLLHDFTVADGRREDVDWVERAIDTNSRAELANLCTLAAGWARLDERVISFEDSVHVDGPAERVYDFLHRADLWPERLPHVDGLELTEDEPGVQVMTMNTRTPDGSAHTTESVRVCFPEDLRIVYKQTATPALMTAHTGCWTVRPAEGGGLTVTSQHSVVLCEEAIEGALGAGVDLAQARRQVREALGRNSGATLLHAKRFAESAVLPV